MGIELGIGIDAQPANIKETIINSPNIRASLALFFNFECSPIDLYNLAQNHGFR